MTTKQHFRDDIYILYYTDTTKITNSYLLNNEEIKTISEQIEFSRKVKFDWKCIHKRDKKSYIKEIKAHNNLYNLGLFRSHTIDCDLEEEQTIILKIIYSIIGR